MGGIQAVKGTNEVFVSFLGTIHDFYQIEINLSKNSANDIYPEFGHASDYSWVAGKVRINTIEGGCVYVDYLGTAANKENYYGPLTINPQKIAKNKNLKEGDFVVLKGKLGGSKFSMACPYQLYDTEEILLND